MEKRYDTHTHDSPTNNRTREEGEHATVTDQKRNHTQTGGPCCFHTNLKYVSGRKKFHSELHRHNSHVKMGNILFTQKTYYKLNKTKHQVKKSFIFSKVTENPVNFAHFQFIYPNTKTLISHQVKVVAHHQSNSGVKIKKKQYNT